MSINKLSEGTTADDGSLQSLHRKTSQYVYDDNAPHYAHLEPANMFTCLVALYKRAFATRWIHFSRVSEVIYPAGTPIEECQRLMAELYISHWMMDLYTSVRSCVNEIAPVANVECVPLGSNVYDTFLVHLNSSIRPTNINGCINEALYIPYFGDNIDTSNNNPFNIQGFTLNLPSLMDIINAIKVVWEIATLTNETFGRPVWLFDWHTDARVCSWFPREGNYTYEDVMYAYVIGVACIPKQAPKDSDDWQPIPMNMTADCIDMMRVSRVEPRRYCGDYEVDTYEILEEKFSVPLDESQPSDDTSMEMIEQTLIRHTTFIYYDRVIFVINDDDRLTTLLGLLEGVQAHSICADLSF